MRILLDPNTDNAAGDLSGLLEQLKAAIPSAASASTSTSTSTATSTKEKGDDKPDEKPAGTDPMAHVYKYLGDIESRLKAKEKQDKDAEERSTRDSIAKQITKLIGDGDMTKVRAALTQLDEHYSTRIGEKDRALEAVQGRLHETVRRAALGDSLAGVKFVTGAAARDAAAKLEAKLEVVSDASGSPVVREKGTGRAVADVVKDALASEEFAHFLDASSRGGGVGLGNRSAPSPSSSSKEPTLAEQIKAKIAWQKEQWKAQGLETTPGFGRPAK